MSVFRVRGLRLQPLDPPVSLSCHPPHASSAPLLRPSPQPLPTPPPYAPSYASLPTPTLHLLPAPSYAPSPSHAPPPPLPTPSPPRPHTPTPPRAAAHGTPPCGGRRTRLGQLRDVNSSLIGLRRAVLSSERVTPDSLPSHTLRHSAFVLT